MKQSESFSNSLYTDQMHLAKHELSAFIAAVAELFGADQAMVSVEDWLDEMELMDASPRSAQRDWQAVTIAASVRLTNRLNIAHHKRSLGTSKTGTEVSPIPSSNCFDSTLVFDALMAADAIGNEH